MSRRNVHLATAAAAALLLLVGTAGASAFPFGDAPPKPAAEPAPKPAAAKGAADAGVLRVGGDVKEPALVNRVQPTYPEEARKNRVQGRVILEAVIDAKGIVTSVKSLESPDPALTEAAIAAVKQWTYKPATKDGKPVKVYLTVTVNFRLA